MHSELRDRKAVSAFELFRLCFQRPRAHQLCWLRPCRTVSRALHSGFTLIELLVVISIIIILMGLLFPAFRGVQNQARKTQAKNDVTQIVTAVNAFYTEYGRYPVPSTVTTDTIYGIQGTSNPNSTILNELRATTTSLNSRQIVFITPPDVKDPNNPKAGIASKAVTANGISVGIGDYVDPWGTPYNLETDANYDNQISNPYPDTDGSAGATQLRIGAIAWSWGSDQVKGTKTPASANFKGSDDVISWQ